MDNSPEIRRPGEDMIIPVAPGRRPLTLDLKPIQKAISRLQEIRLVSPTRSGELLHLFNQGCLDCRDHIRLLNTEKHFVEQFAKKMQYQAIFDRLPSILKEKGLANARSPVGSEDIRTMFLSTDAEYQSALDLKVNIEAAIEFFDARHEALKRAYFATHKLTEKAGPSIVPAELQHIYYDTKEDKNV